MVQISQSLVSLPAAEMLKSLEEKKKEIKLNK